MAERGRGPGAFTVACGAGRAVLQAWHWDFDCLIPRQRFDCLIPYSSTNLGSYKLYQYDAEYTRNARQSTGTFQVFSRRARRGLRCHRCAH